MRRLSAMLILSLGCAGCKSSSDLSSALPTTGRDLRAVVDSFVSEVYDNESWGTSTYSVVEAQGLTPEQQPGQQIQFTAYRDLACSQTAAGNLIMTTNPIPLTGLTGQVENMRFVLANALEETVYIKTEVTGASAVCHSGVHVKHKFVSGSGFLYTSNGTIGLAGGVGSNVYDQPQDAVHDSNGRYLVVGHSWNAGGRNETTLWRFNPNGTLDTTFGTSGTGWIVYSNNGTGAAGALAASKSDRLFSVAEDAQGRYVVLGTSRNDLGRTELVVYRFLADGSVDTTFATAGMYRFNPSGVSPAGASAGTRSDSASALRLTSDGKIVIQATTRNTSGGTESFFMRLTSAGALDTAFGTSGFAFFNVNGTGPNGRTAAARNETARDFQIDQLGRIVGVETFRASPSDSGTRMALVRYTSAGQLDTAFGTSGNGYAYYNLLGPSASGGTGSGRIDWGQRIKVDSDGKYVVAGMSNNNGNKATVWRFNPDGILDATFNGSGVMTINTTLADGSPHSGSDDEFYGLGIDSQNRIVAAGWAPSTGNGYSFAVCRILPNGSLDTTFGAGSGATAGCSLPRPAGLGIVGTTGTAVQDFVYNMLLDKFDRPLVFGDSNTAGNSTFAAFARFTRDGQPDR